MKIIDISGPIFNGMWSYEKSYPEFNHTKEELDYCGDKYSIEKLFMIDAYVLKIPHDELGEKDNKSYITLKDIKKAEKDIIPEGSAILVGTGYGKN